MNIKKTDELSSEMIESLKSKKTHLICLAKPNGPICSQIIKESLGMNEKLLINCCEKVNNLKEVGTLYPEYFVTLFPYDKGVDLHQTLSDVFIANENYLKTSKMVFAFESFDFFSPELMEMVIMELWNDSMLCKEILFYLKK
jgi:hypothetical protein